MTGRLRLGSSPARSESEEDDRDTGEPASDGNRVLRAGLIVLPTIAPVAIGLALGTSGRPFTIGLAMAAVLALVCFYALRARPVELFVSLFIWLTVERFAVASISPALDADSLRWILSYKELFFPALLVILAPRLLRAWRAAPPLLRAVDLLAVGFGAIVIVGFVLSDASVLDRIVNGRRLTVLPLAYIVARLLPWDARSLRSTVTVFVAGALAVSALGLVERSILERLIWSDGVPAAYYYHLSTAAGLSASGTDFPVRGLPVVFFDFTSGEPLRRLVSTFLEATTVASFLALAAIVAFAVRPIQRRWVASALVIGLATVLALSKAGWAILGVGLAYTLAATLWPRLRDPAWLVSMAAALIGALVVIALVLESTGLATGPLAHFEGLKEGIESALRNPLGVGLGYGGNFGATKLGAESTFGVTLVQLGWPGLAVWMSWLIGLAIVTASLGRHVRGLELVSLATGAALAAFLGTAALTESAGGLLGNWPYGFIAGAIITVGAAEWRRGTATAEPR